MLGTVENASIHLAPCWEVWTILVSIFLAPCWVGVRSSLGLPCCSLWARYIYLQKSTGYTQEAVALSRQAWKIIDWDVKPLPKQNKNIKWFIVYFLWPCRSTHAYISKNIGFIHSVAHHIIPWVAKDRVDKTALLKSSRHPYKIWILLSLVMSTGRVKLRSHIVRIKTVYLCHCC